MPGRDDFPRAGHPNGDAPERPADLAAVQADDALLDMLSSFDDTPSDAGDDLTRVLAAWRREVHAAPVRELVDTDTAMAVIRAARQPARRRNPLFGSIAAAAAVLVIAFSAVGLVAKSAQPGDQLWGVTQVLYGDYARSVETAAAVRTELQEANTALSQGNPQRARAALQRVQQQLPAVADSEGRTDLTARHRQLEQILKEAPDSSSAKVPGAPMSPRSPDSGARQRYTPRLNEPDPSAESSATQSAKTPSSASVTPSTEVPSGRGYPRPGYPRPGKGTPGSDPTGDRGTTSGDGNQGNANPGGGATTGADATSSGDTGAQDLSGSSPAPPSPTANSGNSTVRPRHYPGDDRNPGVPPGCGGAGPRPPWCGPASGG